MSEDRDIRDRNNPNIGLVAVEEAVRGPVAVARQRGVVLAVLVRPDGVVEDGVQGAAVNRVAFGHRDVGKAADINFSKVNHFVPDDRSWESWCRFDWNCVQSSLQKDLLRSYK